MKLLLGGLCIFVLVLIGCEPAPTTPAGTPQPIESVTGNTPEDVVRDFLEAWNQQDLATMYSFVSLPSREVYPYEVFERRYQAVTNTITIDGIVFTLADTTIQGTSAAVRYSITINSPQFGEIEDTNRTMRLIRAERGWQIAWTPLDILNGMASEVSVLVDSRFPQRANIYDRNGDYVVQEGGTIVILYAIKNDMRDVEDCTTLLAEAMLRPRAEIARLFTNYNGDTLFFVGEMDVEYYQRWREDLNATCGIFDDGSTFSKVREYSARRYVGHGAALHISGYIGRIPGEQVAQWQARGYQQTDIVGISGIEYRYQDDLAGKPERYLRMIEPGGTTLRELGGSLGSEPTPVQLTIDMGLQYATAKAINDAFNYAQINWATQARGAAAVVMDINSGAILALVSYPYFDPSIFNPDSSYPDSLDRIVSLTNDPRRPFINKAVAEQYTPGSVYKIFTMVAADTEGMFPTDQLFPCELEWYGGEKYGDALEFREDWRVADEMEAAGDIYMWQALSTSCNPFFWEMGALMFRRNANLQADYAALFGFGSKSGFDALGPEAAGNIARPGAISQAINNAIGQGDVQVTALQMATAVTAVANRGTLYQPFIVQQVGGFDDTPIQAAYEPRVIRRFDLPDAIYDEVWRGMCNVPVDDELGTAWRAFIAVQPLPYTSCGKTGTAETGARGSGSPPNAWYVSFAPAENPQIVTVVVVPNSREGSEVAAPITRRILDYYFDAPVAAYPEWWEETYVPLEQPVGVGE